MNQNKHPLTQLPNGDYICLVDVDVISVVPDEDDEDFYVVELSHLDDTGMTVLATLDHEWNAGEAGHAATKIAHAVNLARAGGSDSWTLSVSPEDLDVEA